MHELQPVCQPTLAYGPLSPDGFVHDTSGIIHDVEHWVALAGTGWPRCWLEPAALLARSGANVACALFLHA